MPFERLLITTSEVDHTECLLHTLRKFFKLNKKHLLVLRYLMKQERAKGVVALAKVECMKECGIKNYNTLNNALRKLEASGIIESVHQTQAYILNESLFDPNGAEFLLKLRYC